MRCFLVLLSNSSQMWLMTCREQHNQSIVYGTIQVCVYKLPRMSHISYNEAFQVRLQTLTFSAVGLIYHIYMHTIHICIIFRFGSSSTYLSLNVIATKASQCFDQHSWKDDKTTLNSFGFCHWLINWHKKHVLNWNSTHAFKRTNNWVWRSSEVVAFGTALTV